MAQWMTLAGLQQSAMSSPFAQFEGHADLSRSTVVGTLTEAWFTALLERI